MNDLKYRPEIDGLRAVSVIGVLLFHAKVGCTGGYVGVDVFFVISGYLITSLILQDLDAGKFSFMRFWERRIRRIVPAMVVTVVAALFVGYLLMLPADFEALGESALAQAAIVANVYFWRDVGYFAGGSELKPLLHTWSLAVEEQFYLVLPLALFLLHRWNRRRIPGVLLLVATASFAISAVGAFTHPSATFYLLPTRAWELLAGSLLATRVAAAESKPSIRNEWVSWSGLSMIIASMLLYDEDTVFPGITAALPVVGSVLLIGTNSNGVTGAGRLLSAPLLVFVGTISYALYLWHWPILAFARYVVDRQLTVPESSMCIALALGISVLSLHLVENPIRRNRERWTAGRVFRFAAASIMSMLIASLIIWRTGGCEWRLSPRLVQDRGDSHRAEIDMVRRGEFPRLGEAGESSRPLFVVWGDSHATVAAELLDELGEDRHFAGISAAHGGNPPLPGVSISWNDDLPEWNECVLEEIVRERIPYVFLVGRWAHYVEGATDYDIAQGRSFNAPMIFTESNHDRGKEASMSLFARSLRSLCDQLTSNGSRVVIVAQVPDLNCDPYRRAFLAERTHGLIPFQLFEASRQQHQIRQSRVNELFASLRSDNVLVVDLSDAFYDESGSFKMFHGSEIVYRDNQHLSDFGVRHFLRPALAPCFDEMARLSESLTGAGQAVPHRE